MATTKYKDPVHSDVPMPGAGVNALETAMLKNISSGLMKSQTDDGGSTGKPYSTGKAKGASPYGAETSNSGS